MNQPCQQEPRLAVIEAAQHTIEAHLLVIDTKQDQTLAAVSEMRGELKNRLDRGFVGGVASVGVVLGWLTIDLIKPFAKPLIAAALAVLK